MKGGTAGISCFGSKVAISSLEEPVKPLRAPFFYDTDESRRFFNVIKKHNNCFHIRSGHNCFNARILADFCYSGESLPHNLFFIFCGQ